MAIGWSLAAKLAGAGLKAYGARKQQKASDRAMSEAQAAQDQYNSEMSAWQQQQANAAHGRAMAAYNERRARELALLKDQGASQEELFQHDKAMRDEQMAEAQNFDYANYQEGVAENQGAAQAEGQGALDDARATREGPNTEGRSTAFKEAAAAAMAGADTAGDTRNAGMSKLTGRTRERGGETSASRRMGTKAAAGNLEKDHLGKMADMRQKRLAYNPPSAPSGPRDLSGMPQEPEMEIQTSSSGNKLSALGSAVGAAGGWLGGKGNSSWIGDTVGGLFKGKTSSGIF